MKIVSPSFTILTEINGSDVLKKLELIGRVCYKSEDKITDESAREFITRIIKNGHEAIIEHFSISVKVVCDRGVSHEIVRHRIASYAQESTRYCNYNKEKFGKEITVIEPIGLTKEQYCHWVNACVVAEAQYIRMLEAGASPQMARSVLPNSLKTEIIITMNLREWRHFFRLRAAPAAHPQMQEIVKPILKKFKELIPVVFDDL